MEYEQSLYTFAPQWIPFLIIYGVTMAICIIAYRAWINRYKKIPDKTVIAKLIKKTDYFGEGGSGYDFESRVSYVLAKYEYYIGRRRHNIKYKCTGKVSETIVLYYKKGNFDIRDKKTFYLPLGLILFLLLFFVAGVPMLAIIFADILGLNIPVSEL